MELKCRSYLRNIKVTQYEIDDYWSLREENIMYSLGNEFALIGKERKRGTSAEAIEAAVDSARNGVPTLLINTECHAFYIRGKIAENLGSLYGLSNIPLYIVMASDNRNVFDTIIKYIKNHNIKLIILDRIMISPNSKQEFNEFVFKLETFYRLHDLSITAYYQLPKVQDTTNKYNHFNDNIVAIKMMKNITSIIEGIEKNEGVTISHALEDLKANIDEFEEVFEEFKSVGTYK